MGSWVWRAYVNTGGYLIGRWRDTFTPLEQKGYEGPLGLIRAGDLFYPPHFPTSMAESRGVSHFEFTPSGATPGPAPGSVDVRRGSEFPLRGVPTPPSRSGSGGSDDPMDGSMGRKRHSEMGDSRWPKRQGSAGSSTSDWGRRDDWAGYPRHRHGSVGSAEWPRRAGSASSSNGGHGGHGWPRRGESGSSGDYEREYRMHEGECRIAPDEYRIEERA